MSATLAAVCCYKGGLPQGAPTSPKLANLVTLRLDSRILGFVGKRGIIYTRYADDLTFSAFSSEKLTASLPFIRFIVASEGFTVNENKTRLAGPGRQHRVTGLVVTERGVGIGRKAVRTLRPRILNLCTHASGEAPDEDLERIRGWIAFVNGVDKCRHRVISDYVERLRLKYPGTAICDLLP